MKKIILALSLFGASVVSAADLTVGGIRDYNVDRDGYRLEVSGGEILNIVPKATVTRIENVYTRYGIGGQYAVAKIGPVDVSVDLTGAYQKTDNGSNGYLGTAGIKGQMNVTKTVAVVAGFERSVGQNRVDQFDGNTGMIGIKVKM